MQLIAYGSQDAFLTGSPQITFFKTMYRRYTNFAVESISQTFNGLPNFGRKVNTIISRNGDLITDMFLQVKVPKVETSSGSRRYYFAKDFGHALLRTIELEIGGQLIDKHYGDWLDILKELTVEESKQAGINQMVGKDLGRADEEHDKYLYIPLQFFFCRNVGLALPLIALQYHEVRVTLEFERTEKLFWYEEDNNGWEFGGTGLAPGDSVSLTDVELWVDYVFLDTEERRRYAQASHEYLIEQLQHTGPESWTSSKPNIRLNFNHPVKALYWVMQDEAESDEKGKPLKYEDALKSLKIQLNGHDRFSPRPGSYFRLVQPMKAQTRVTVDEEKPIYQYSFGLNPEQHQPSGTCNFSRIDTAMMQFLQTADAPAAGKGKIKIFATNYNVLRISSGMGSVAYAS